MKNIIILLFLFIISKGYSQVLDTNCTTPLNQVYENSCIQQSIDTINNNEWITSCVPFQPIGDGNIHFSFILVNSNCGPISPYNNLQLSIYNNTCDSLIVDTTITPPDWDFFTHLDVSTSYILCYTWKAKCTQWSWCPIINESPLQVTFIKTLASFSKEENRIYITWSTASEHNTDYYDVQKLINSEWTNINWTWSHYSTTINTYLVIDEVIQEYNYYRIKEVDFNGISTYSSPFMIKVKQEDVQVEYFNIFGSPIKLQDMKTGMYIKRFKNGSEKIIHVN